MPRPHRHSLSAPRRHDRRWPRRQIRRRLPCRRPLTLPDNRRRRSASPRPPLNEVHQSIAKLGATSTSRFPRPLQNTGSATRKDIKIRASNHIRKRGHAHRSEGVADGKYTYPSTLVNTFCCCCACDHVGNTRAEQSEAEVLSTWSQASPAKTARGVR